MSCLPKSGIDEDEQAGRKIRRWTKPVVTPSIVGKNKRGSKFLAGDAGKRSNDESGACTKAN